MIFFTALTYSPAAQLLLCGSSHFLFFHIDQIDHNSLCREVIFFFSLYLSRGLSSVLETLFSQLSICVSCIELLLMLTYVNPWMTGRSPCNCWSYKITCWALEITSIFTMQALRMKNVNKKSRTNTKSAEKMPHNTRKNIEVWDAMHEKWSWYKRNYACSNRKFNLRWHDGNTRDTVGRLTLEFDRIGAKHNNCHEKNHLFHQVEELCSLAPKGCMFYNLS